MKFRSLAAVVFGVFFMFASSARADERSIQEVGVQGTGFFTKDSSSNLLTQHTTNSGGFLVSYRYHFNRWFAADVSYGWNRYAAKYFVSRILERAIGRSPVHGCRGCEPSSEQGRFNPMFSPTGALVLPDPMGATVPGAGTACYLCYGGGVNYDFTKHCRPHGVSRVVRTPRFRRNALRRSGLTTTAQPSAGVNTGSNFAKKSCYVHPAPGNAGRWIIF